MTSIYETCSASGLNFTVDPESFIRCISDAQEAVSDEIELSV
jgi:hypothetical protein